MERRFAVHADSHRKALIVSIVLCAASAHASPKSKDAKKLFDKGVSAYTKGDYAAAAAALSESYSKEGDPETLFAWAQAEKKQGHCSNAVELYNTLLAFDLPAENKKVIDQQLAECKQAAGSDEKPDKKVEKKEPEKKAEPEKKPEPEKKLEPEKKHEDKVAQVETPPPSEPEDRGPKPEVRATSYAWYKDPVGDALVVGGAVGLGVGIAMYASAHSANADKASAQTYTQFKNDVDTAHDHGLYAVIGLTAGAALVAGGVAWYATHKTSEEHAMVTGWVAPTGGGIAFSRGF